MDGNPITLSDPFGNCTYCSKEEVNNDYSSSAADGDFQNGDEVDTYREGALIAIDGVAVKEGEYGTGVMVEQLKGFGTTYKGGGTYGEFDRTTSKFSGAVREFEGNMDNAIIDYLTDDLGVRENMGLKKLES